MTNFFLSVIIPAYNEEKYLPDTLIDINDFLLNKGFSYEIIVVNDGSTDKTSEVVKKYEKKIKNLVLIDNKDNRGKGFAVRQGMLKAKGRLRLFLDADNSASIDQFQKMLFYFEEEKYDIVIGSRYVKGAKLEPPQMWYRKFLSRIGNFIIQIFFLSDIKDTQCGFKCFTAEVAEKVFSISKIDGFGFDFEILVLSKKLGYKIKEIPIRWVNSPESKVNFKSYFLVFLDVLRLRWWLWFKKYNL